MRADMPRGGYFSFFARFLSWFLVRNGGHTKFFRCSIQVGPVRGVTCGHALISYRVYHGIYHGPAPAWGRMR